MFGEVGDELDCVKHGGGFVVEEFDDTGEVAVVEDLYFALVELGERTEEESACLADEFVFVGETVHDVFDVSFRYYGLLAFLVERDIGQSHAHVVLNLDRHGCTDSFWWVMRLMRRLMIYVFRALGVPCYPCIRILSRMTVLRRISVTFYSISLSTRCLRI